jgi:hypothetical protein
MPFWNWKKKKDPPSHTAQSLSDIARGMQHAVNSTQELTEKHFQGIVERYFTEDGKAIAKRFQLPDGSVLDVPLISLVPPAGLRLEEMYVEMEVRIDKCSLKEAHPDEKELTRTSFECSFAPRKGSETSEQNVIEISMKFKAGDPPEGVARLMEYYANAAVPKPPDKAGPSPAAPTKPGGPAPSAGQPTSDVPKFDPIQPTDPPKS